MIIIAREVVEKVRLDMLVEDLAAEGGRQVVGTRCQIHYR